MLKVVVLMLMIMFAQYNKILDQIILLIFQKYFFSSFMCNNFACVCMFNFNRMEMNKDLDLDRMYCFFYL